MTTTKLATVDFHGNPLTVITTAEGERLVAMQPICEAIGLHWGSQYNRIKRDDVLSTSIFIMKMQMPGDDQKRELTCLPLDYLNGWLFGIDTNRCREEIRPRLVEYKRECYRALAAYWQQGRASRKHVKAKVRDESAVCMSEDEAFNLYGTLAMAERACKLLQTIEPAFRMLDSGIAPRLSGIRSELTLGLGFMTRLRQRCGEVYNSTRSRMQT
ncbi:phage antirepressor N-terminal domain-containing protein [Laribacter hongkongensis]|uniref:Phage antirepressor N-terminal domain-containing protein n=1 Tax=Laribacter hongkongensis TaxID=168471 RepID=A0ABD4SU52_9NEIS|nr:phage antirepressor N-terminal domain-containing protein [Laribacter hongkongensis]MCG9026742.1 phage antirepressor N-terminal domain-containing protein [Laribacter hongkongensis]MCG9101626.1 phage antirepressor N-terminal domain-containing protein [Laribacter hongkongensis]MCG9104248.1 phage antirepressor N-terminal domain-containing protein [Laribacter hongkongensis]MCG9113481.1 phage antirepressor N-terminal domain-containing protein [Laribacter hongkongensis]MCG9119219.1 phage antirepre